MEVVAIVLAAGQSRRFGSNKLAAPYHGRPLGLCALEAVCTSSLVSKTLLVVTPDSETIWAGDPSRWTQVVNFDAAEGMGTSLRAGVRAAPASAEAFIILLADMPGITRGLVEELIRFAEASGKSIVLPVHQGRRGHPVLFKSGLRERLESLAGDLGARMMIRELADEVALYPTEDPAVLRDVDTPEDLRSEPGSQDRRG